MQLQREKDKKLIKVEFKKNYLSHSDRCSSTTWPQITRTHQS